MLQKHKLHSDPGRMGDTVGDAKSYKISWGLFELWPPRDVCFSDVACIGPTTSSPGADIFLTTSLPRRFTSSYTPCLMDSHTNTHTHIITHKHTLSLKPSAPPHPTTSLAFDYMSGDVYGPLFAVLMIIVTGWFHYQELSDGWVPTLTSTDTGVLDHWGRRNEQRSGGFMKGGSVRSRVVSFIYVSYSLKTCISVRRSGGWLEKWWGPDGAEIFLRFVGWQRQFMKSENETW